MTEKTEALRLAEDLEIDYCGDVMAHKAAAELRRLHAENESLRQIVQDFPPIEAELEEVSDRAHRLEQQRDALRAELKEATEAINDPAVNNLRTLPESIRMLWTQRDALLEALQDAATSLETISRLAGRSDYVGDDGERIPTYMGHHDQVRGYATSRATAARAAIKAVEGEKK